MSDLLITPRPTVTADAAVAKAGVQAALHDLSRHLRTLTFLAAEMRAAHCVDAQLGAAALYAARRARGRFFDGLADFRDPAWDILLDLFVAHEQGRPVSVSSACLAAAVPPTTGLRHLELLIASGAITRTPDLGDLRRIEVAITPIAADAMRGYLAWLDARRINP